MTYQYNVPLRLITSEEYKRNNQVINTITTTYDAWGNPTYFYDNFRQLEEGWTYLSHATIKNLVATHTVKNKNPITNITSSVKTSYQYNTTLGKPTWIEVDDGTNKITRSLTYDLTYGNLLSNTENLSNGKRVEYLYDDLKHAFLKERKLVQVRNADGVLADIVSSYQYNWETGLKEWEVDPLGNKTEYEYDVLNRLIKVTLPDDDLIDTNNPYRSYLFDDVNNKCTYTNEKGQQSVFNFDTLGRLTEIIKDTSGDNSPSNYPTEIKVAYHYDDRGRIDTVTDARNFVTTYSYDDLNRVTRVTFPDSNYAMLNYIDATNTIEIIDENGVDNGAKVTERNDWAGRLAEARQECAFEGTTNTYTWSFTYDSLGKKLRQIDPLAAQTDQEFDVLGRLVKVKLPSANLMLPGNTQPTAHQATLRYEYDLLGNKTAEVSPLGNLTTEPGNYKVSYDYDQLGRKIKMIAKATDKFTNLTVEMTTKYYYDANGNLVKTIDPKGREWQYTYSARGWRLTESDPSNNTVRYQYDVLGNKTAVTDPRGNGTDGTYTTWFLYDSLNRLYRTILPDNTPLTNEDNPYTEVTYDASGNKLSERDANGIKAYYEYNSRNWLMKVKDNHEQVQREYTYDKRGRVLTVKDALGKTTTSLYDSLGRLRRVTDPLNYSQNFNYNAVGNRTVFADARGNVTTYNYNQLGWLTGVVDPLTHATEYRYDPNGNQVISLSATSLQTTQQYDELNRLVERVDSTQTLTKYSYDLAGNLSKMVDPRGTDYVYQYYPNNLLERVDLTGADGTSYWAAYTYDAAGNRLQVSDSGNTINYTVDPLNRVQNISRQFDGATYQTAFRYNPGGLVTGIYYPEASAWLEYNYNDLNQLDEVVGFTKPDGIGYNLDGSLKSINYANNAVANYQYDANGRLDDLAVTSGGQTLLNQTYQYDEVGNIKQIRDGQDVRVFDYDANNQLIRAVTPGKFLEKDETPGLAGTTIGDFLGHSNLIFNSNQEFQQAVISIDYGGSSIGIDFGTVAPGIKQIKLAPDQGHQTHRLNDQAIGLYVSNDNSSGSYTLIPRTAYDYTKDSQGVITLTLKQTVATRFLKIHIYLDERGKLFNVLTERATFLNQTAKLLRVYQESTSRTEDYQYDADGNRKAATLTLIQATYQNYEYYPNSHWLKTNGQYAFIYDNAGNMVKKGNRYTPSGNSFTFTTSGEGVEYWEYDYDLLNRLIKVRKNGTIVAEYGYDPEGYRVIKRAKGETTHYVFLGTEPIFEKKISRE